MGFDSLVCWEPSDVNDPMVRSAGRLYEQTLDADERIPWVWIERSVEQKPDPRPGGWSRRLILAALAGEAGNPDKLAGYVYGAFISGYGGYLCYVGVADWARRLGVATQLYDAFYRAMRADAEAAGEPLPFVIWESHHPEPEAEAAAHDLWQARVRLFDRVGGHWLEGIEFLSPNFDDDEAPPVPLQLFLRPMDTPASAFTPDHLRKVVAGLHDRVYRYESGDSLYDATMATAERPRLVPAKLAGRVLNVVSV